MQNRTTIITITNRVVSRLKIIAFKRCGGAKNVPKIKRREKENCCLINFSNKQLNLTQLKRRGEKCEKQYKLITFCWY